MLTLFAYVDGFDLEDVEGVLVERFGRFVREWGVSTARIVNDRRPRKADLKEGDWPEWNLGLNFTVDRLPRDKIEDLVRFLTSLARETGRDIAIGAAGANWFMVDASPSGNLVELLAEQLA